MERWRFRSERPWRDVAWLLFERTHKIVAQGAKFGNQWLEDVREDAAQVAV